MKNYEKPSLQVEMKKILLTLTLLLCCMMAAWAGTGDDFVNVASASQMYNVLSGNARAKVRLTQDIYLSDLGADFGDTFCSTFYGILDGDGHAIKGDHYADNTTQRRNRCYLFTYADGATFKNLTFKHINKESKDHSNQAIITSQAKNGCVFENITFDNCGTWTNHNNAGAAAGYAYDNCTFRNITVRNSDFSTDCFNAGAVVGSAKNCIFSDIKVENCQIAASLDWIDDGGQSGGVAGNAEECTFTDVEVHGSYIKTNSKYAGGVVGYAKNSELTNCMVDDQSCVCSDGSLGDALAGGITGVSSGGAIYNCVNSALIAIDADYGGGITGGCEWGAIIDGCLNTGLIISIHMEEVETGLHDTVVENGLYYKYRTKTDMTCFNKTYQGKEYAIRVCNKKYKSTYDHAGGIAGTIQTNSKITRCVNLGSVHSDKTEGDMKIYFSGGIVGVIEGGTVSDCLVDFLAISKVRGICGAVKYGATIKNCLNMTSHLDFAPWDDWYDFVGENNYSRTMDEDAQYINKITYSDLESGKICRLLGKCWEQNLGTDIYPTPTGDRGIYHMRDVNCKDYGTICVPFPLETLKGVGIDHREYYLFDEVKNEADGTISICFKYTDVVPAGTPAIFRAYVNSDYYFLPKEKEYQFEVQPTVGTEWTFNGTFEQKVFEGDDAKSIYYLDGTAGSSAIKNAKKTTIAPYRAYFEGPSIDKLTGNGASQPKSVRFVIEDEDGETTALELVYENHNENENRSYTLFGTEAGEGYRGIVIRGGKKVIVNN